MPCPNDRRKRSVIVNFRVSPEEREQIEARIKVIGLSKSEYFIKTFLAQEINIIVGKYQSDRLSLEFKRLREAVEKIDLAETDENYDLLLECKSLLTELKPFVEEKKTNELKKEDFEEK